VSSFVLALFLLVPIILIPPWNIFFCEALSALSTPSIFLFHETSGKDRQTVQRRRKKEMMRQGRNKELKQMKDVKEEVRKEDKEVLIGGDLAINSAKQP
jgi:hypothetical protein